VVEDRRPVVIVGASIAGLTAAEAYRMLSDEPILLVDADPNAPYDRTALSKEILTGAVQAEGDIALRTRESLTQLGIELRVGTTVTALDARRGELVTSDGRQRYSSLLIATGVAPIVPFEVDPAATVHVLRTLDQALVLRHELHRGPHVRLVVIGGGLIGCEVASAGRDLGLDTTLVAPEPGPFALPLGAAVAARLHEIQKRAGVTCHYGRQVDRVYRDGEDLVVELAGGGRVRGDVVVAGTGVVANTAWLHGSGVAIDGGVLTDDCFATNVAGVFAVGDVARWPGGPDGELVRLEHWTTAADQGAAVARVMAHGTNPAPLPQPYFSSHLHGCRVQVLGHTARVDQVSLLPGAESSSFVAAYRSGTRLVGLATVDLPRVAARAARLVADHAPWDEAVETLERLAAPEVAAHAH
jgi:NADPH-dependent 2,4-dienoyl-CoA reductase/sulfur reductase-like enzyme